MFALDGTAGIVDGTAVEIAHGQVDGLELDDHADRRDGAARLDLPGIGEFDLDRIARELKLSSRQFETTGLAHGVAGAIAA
jgi:hypothetical protein